LLLLLLILLVIALFELIQLHTARQVRVVPVRSKADEHNSDNRQGEARIEIHGNAIVAVGIVETPATKEGNGKDDAGQGDIALF